MKCPLLMFAMQLATVLATLGLFGIRNNKDDVKLTATMDDSTRD